MTSDASLGAVQIELRAADDKLARDLKKGEARVEGFAGSARRSLKKLQDRIDKVSFAKAATAAAAVGVGLVFAFSKAIELADKLGKQSFRIGITPEELQKLRFAFDQGGTSIEDTDSALQRFSRSLGLARIATSEGERFLERYGISLRDEVTGNARETVDVLFDVADAMRDLDSSSERAAFAQGLFEEAGQKLIPTLAQGSDAIRAQGERLEAMGGILRNEVVAEAESAKDSLGALATILSTQFQRALISAAPAVTSFVTELTRADGPLSKLTAFLELIGPASLRSTDDLRKRATELALEIERLSKVPGADLTAGLRAELAEISRVLEARVAFAKQVADAPGALQGTLSTEGIRALREQEQAFERLSAVAVHGLEAIAVQQARIKAEQQAVTTGLERGSAAFEDFVAQAVSTDRARIASDLAIKSAKAQAELSDQLEAQGKIAAAAALGVEAYARATDAATVRAKLLAAGLTEGSAAFERQLGLELALAEATRNAQRSRSQALAGDGLERQRDAAERLIAALAAGPEAVRAVEREIAAESEAVAAGFERGTDAFREFVAEAARIGELEAAFDDAFEKIEDKGEAVFEELSEAIGDLLTDFRIFSGEGGDAVAEFGRRVLQTFGDVILETIDLEGRFAALAKSSGFQSLFGSILGAALGAGSTAVAGGGADIGINLPGGNTLTGGFNRPAASRVLSAPVPIGQGASFGSISAASLPRSSEIPSFEIVNPPGRPAKIESVDQSEQLRGVIRIVLAEVDRKIATGRFDPTLKRTFALERQSS